MGKDKTGELFGCFMPRRWEITNNLNSDVVCLQVYGSEFNFHRFDPSGEFDKWAAVEVDDFSRVPSGMEILEMSGGLYAVFDHTGGPATASKTFTYIFGTWLPHSGYEIDSRPHFEIIGEKYKHSEPDSEEEIWIPIRKNI